MTPQTLPLLGSVLLEDGDGGRFPATFEPLPPASDLAGSGLNWPTAITLIVLIIAVTVLFLGLVRIAVGDRRKSGLRERRPGETHPGDLNIQPSNREVR
jgi:hypothetical protein